MTFSEFSCDLSKVLSREPGLDALKLDELLSEIPTVDRLEGLPAGTPVLLRLDLDVPISGSAIADDSRLVVALDTLNYCRNRGWKTVVFGQLGRDGTKTLALVRDALSDLLGIPVLFFNNWIRNYFTK